MCSTFTGENNAMYANVLCSTIKQRTTDYTGVARLRPKVNFLPFNTSRLLPVYNSHSVDHNTCRHES
ncbi:hypothetical protein QTP88_012500 [Uroleucon formosanum]